MYLNTKNLLLFGLLPISISIGNGIYESWNYLDEFELERENYKTTRRRIEKSSIGFGIGFMNGIALSFMSPFILSGSIIATVHYKYNKKT